MEKREQFSDRLHTAINRCGSPVCVGLDPVLESLPEEVRARHHEPLVAISEFCSGVLKAVAPGGKPIVPAVKFQSACFERYGSRGVAVLEEQVAAAAALGLVIIWDAKRGDISTSASHYAAAAVRLRADAITVSAYLGASGVTPFLDTGLGVFALVRTSNPDSDAVQGQKLADGRSVGEVMAAHVAELGGSRLGGCGLSDLGAVVGATKASEGAALRALMPRQVFLVPGYGAQGGTAEDIRALLRPGARSPADTGVLVTASRSIIYAKTRADETWDAAVRGAAERMRDEIGAVVASGFRPVQR
jgi:orotidine-5'-phosphate decarboxylase